jgi:hypothetical protein
LKDAVINAGWVDPEKEQHIKFIRECEATLHCLLRDQTWKSQDLSVSYQSQCYIRWSLDLAGPYHRLGMTLLSWMQVISVMISPYIMSHRPRHCSSERRLASLLKVRFFR